MTRRIVVFERDGRYTESGKPELGFRLLRGALPTGAAPLAIVLSSAFEVVTGQYFSAIEVARYAARESGHPFKEEGIQPGHFACGVTSIFQLNYSMPRQQLVASTRRMT